MADFLRKSKANIRIFAEIMGLILRRARAK